MTNMSDDTNNTNDTANQDSQGETEALSESTLQDLSQHSETVEKGGEVTEPGDGPEGGYIMAPTDNDPNRGDGTGTESDSSGNDD